MSLGAHDTIYQSCKTALPRTQLHKPESRAGKAGTDFGGCPGGSNRGELMFALIFSYLLCLRYCAGVQPIMDLNFAI